MIERIYILCLIIIIKSEVWTITHCLGLGHETMVCTVCLSVFFMVSQITSHWIDCLITYAGLHQREYQSFTLLPPVPLSIFRSNSKFDENSERSSFEYTWPITTIFCTRHDSDTVVTCARYGCDRPRIFYTRVFWIFIEFRIRSKYA